MLAGAKARWAYLRKGNFRPPSQADLHDTCQVSFLIHDQVLLALLQMTWYSAVAANNPGLKGLPLGPGNELKGLECATRKKYTFGTVPMSALSHIFHYIFPRPLPFITFSHVHHHWDVTASPCPNSLPPPYLSSYSLFQGHQPRMLLLCLM